MTEKNVLQGNGWVADMIKYYDQGMADEEVCRELNITMKQFESHCIDSPAFKDLVDRGRDYAKAFWLKFNRLAAQKQLDASSDLLKFLMINRYGYGQKNDLSKTNVEPLDRAKIEEQLVKELPDFYKNYVSGKETIESASRKVLSGTNKH